MRLLGERSLDCWLGPYPFPPLTWSAPVFHAYIQTFSFSDTTNIDKCRPARLVIYFRQYSEITGKKLKVLILQRKLSISPPPPHPACLSCSELFEREGLIARGGAVYWQAAMLPTQLIFSSVTSN